MSSRILFQHRFSTVWQHVGAPEKMFEDLPRVSFWGPILSLDIRSQAPIQPRASMKVLRRHRAGLLKQGSYVSCLVSVRLCAFCATFFRGHDTLNPTWNMMGLQYRCYSPDVWNEIPLCEEDFCIWDYLLMPAVSTAQSDNLALR